YISAWIRRFETIVRRPLIRDAITREDVYDEWYDRVTHHFILSTNRVQTIGYQVGDASLMQFLTMLNRRMMSYTERSSSSVEGDTTSRTQIPHFTGHTSLSYHCPLAADVARPSTLPVSPDDVYRPVPVSDNYFPFHPL
ncbi:hypothetical protein Pfo_020361, partial [Paulownia fortunei]